MKVPLVTWSTERDRSGKQMVLVCSGSHYPQEMARQIAKEILELIGPDGDGKLVARKDSKFNAAS